MNATMPGQLAQGESAFREPKQLQRSQIELQRSERELAEWRDHLIEAAELYATAKRRQEHARKEYELQLAKSLRVTTKEQQAAA